METKTIITIVCTIINIAIFVYILLRLRHMSLEYKTVAAHNSRLKVDLSIANLEKLEACQENTRLRIRLFNSERKAAEIQDKYSAVVCPTSNHLWDDIGGGVKRCRRCGRERMVEDA